MTNDSLNIARSNKNDEFYTRYIDVEEELTKYDLSDKIVYCNCDNLKSNFYIFLKLNFFNLGLKEIVCTSLDGEKIVFDGTNETVTPLCSGDFLSKECVEILKYSDVLITNPPFSRFRDYINLVMECNKKFLLLGNLNAITYNEIFPSIKNNKVWLGYRSINKDMYFQVPEERQRWLIENKKEGSAYKIVNGIIMGRLASACWFTNLDHKKRHQLFDSGVMFKDGVYDKYDNYDAINVDKIKDIPMDYTGIMGVPITFLGKYNPDQFELLGVLNAKFYVNGKEKYKRLAIRKKYY